MLNAATFKSKEVVLSYLSGSKGASSWTSMRDNEVVTVVVYAISWQNSTIFSRFVRDVCIQYSSYYEPSHLSPSRSGKFEIWSAPSWPSLSIPKLNSHWLHRQFWNPSYIPSLKINQRQQYTGTDWGPEKKIISRRNVHASCIRRTQLSD